MLLFFLFQYKVISLIVDGQIRKMQFKFFKNIDFHWYSFRCTILIRIIINWRKRNENNNAKAIEMGCVVALAM